MSLQWTLVAGFLYAEMGVVILLMLPFLSPKMWQKFFKSRFLRSLAAYSNFYFSAFFVILLLLFLDSLRQMNKYALARDQELDHGHLDAELQQSMKMFRAQRNCYIAGFALFLAPVIRRIASLISQQAQLLATSEASLKQAKSASEAAEKLLKEKDIKDKEGSAIAENEGNTQRQIYEEKIEELKAKLKESEKELEQAKLNLAVVRDQAEGTNREYDRLLKEYEQIQQKLSQASGDTAVKKDE